MKKLNKHGMKMVGIKKASGETKNYGPWDGRYNEIFYNTETGEVWAVFQCSLGHNTWTEYHDPAVIKICNATEHMTMQEIADAIQDRVSLCA